jgi:hypothetical protein
MHPVKAAAYGTPIAGATVAIGPRSFNGGDPGNPGGGGRVSC